MVASIWSSNSDMALTCWRIIHFNFLLTTAIFASICFCRASGLAFLVSLNFLFTRGYHISTRVEIFHITTIFFNAVYQVEISTQDENLHIISPLDRNKSLLMFHSNTFSINKNFDDNEHLLKCTSKNVDIIIVFETRWN